MACFSIDGVNDFPVEARSLVLLIKSALSDVDNTQDQDGNVRMF